MGAGQITETAGIAAPSLRSDFAWTLAGNVIYAASQWAILSMAAKLGGPEMLGQYALVVALTMPIVMLAHLNLRAVLATDMERRHSFGDYLTARLMASVAGLLAVACQAAVSSGLGAMILLASIAQSSEAVSDLYYGALQRRGEMETIGRSMMIRGALSAGAFGLTLYGTGNLAWSLAAMAAARIVVLVVYDRARGSAGEAFVRSGARGAMQVIRTAAPLGIVLLLVSLNTNLPRYAIEHFLGTRDLGAFAAVAAFITVGSTVMNALGQSATPRLARYASTREPGHFLRYAMRLAGAGFGLGLAGAGVAAAIGPFVLRIVYGRQFDEYGGLLVGVMGAAALSYAGIGLGFAITAARAFDAQAPLFCVVAATCGGASWLLAPKFGLWGAVLALSLAALVQISGEALLLRRALRGMAAAQ